MAIIETIFMWKIFRRDAHRIRKQFLHHERACSFMDFFINCLLLLLSNHRMQMTCVAKLQ